MFKIKFSKKGTFILASFMTASIVFFFFVYTPKANKLKEVKQKVKAVQDELKDVEEIISQGRSLSDFMGASKENIETLEGKFPSSEEAAIAGVSKVASRHQMSVLSIRSSIQDIDPEKEFGQSVADKKVKKATFDILLLGSYIQLGEFLKELREDFENLVILDDFTVNQSSTPGELRIRMKLYLYLML